MKDDQGFADRMISMPKYVVSRTLGNPAWTNTKSIRANAQGEVLKLRAQVGREVLVLESSRLVQGTARAGLVDEYRLLVYPVVLGEGKRVFANEGHLKLIESRRLEQVALLRYEPSEKGIFR